MAFGVVSFGRKTLSAIKSTEDFERRVQHEMAILKRQNKEFPVVAKLFGVNLRSQRIPAWFVGLIIGIFVASIVYGLFRGS
jgi:hypothetical protein